MNTDPTKEPLGSMSRNNARLEAKARQRAFFESGERFELLAENYKFLNEVQKLVIEHVQKGNSVGVFAGLAKWFEAQNLEDFLSQCVGDQNPIDFAYPKTKGEELEFFISTQNRLIEEKTWGLLEPSGNETLSHPSLVFVPCTLADLEANRMGRGKGFYDRYLNTHPETFAVGVVHDAFLVPRFEPEWILETDHLLHGLLTNTRFVTPYPHTTRSTKEKTPS